MIRFSFVFLLFISFTGFSQLNFNTGSAELDADLNSINVEANTNLSLFKTDISAEFSVSEKKIDYLFSIGMEAGEVYLTLEISSISGKTIDDVAACYKTNKSKGWGYIAKEMGIKPGSPEFHQLKGNSKKKKDKSNKGNKGNGNSKGKKK